MQLDREEQSPSQPARGRGQRGCATVEDWAARTVVVLVVVGLAACVPPALFPSEQSRSRDRVARAYREFQSDALLLAQEHVARYPDDLTGLALAARAAGKQSNHELAIRYLKQLPADGGRWEFYAQRALAERYEILGTLEPAERHARRALELFPCDLEANNRLGHLLQVQGRTWESAPYFFMVIRRGKCRGDELMGMAVTDRFFRSDERLDRVNQAQDSPELLLKLKQAREGLFENRPQEAERLLREVLAERPDLGEAQGRLGRIIVDRGDLAEFLQWRGSLPEQARNHPEVWYVEGLEARRLGQLEGAVQCLLEVTARSPNHLPANLQLAGCLHQLGLADEAQAFSRRAEALAELEANLNLLRSNVDPELMIRVARLFAALGRYWEAAGWCHVLKRLEREDLVPAGVAEGWTAAARAEHGADAPSQFPARLLKGRKFSAPRWPITAAGAMRAASPQSADRAWQFTDDASRLGIEFDYFEGTSEEHRLNHIFSVTGGGLGALDYDNDGWPDLYLAQANDWRNPEPQPQYNDRLFRNLNGERFVDVTSHSLPGDADFSHGVTAGDFDQDGFLDMHVGNLGPNRLCRNNGDGTFADATAAAGVGGNEWSTSSVFADFNGDGLPDLYVANYTDTGHTAEKECYQGTGELMSCTPDLLVAEADRFYLNSGDGTFRDVSAEAGILVSGGKGLATIAWDFAGNGTLGVFVANDTSPNFLFVNRGTDSHGTPHFVEEGLVRGVAVDVDGNALASMGVAAGDITGDGRIDLFISTFFGESNVLYAQREDGLFDDLTRTLKLREPGFWMLGFGSQFADFDVDGWDDLIVTNGHVNQRSSRGDEDRMPPQVYHNLSGRQFVEVPAGALGEFFHSRYLGRGLATLDWNRDGLSDVGISHIHAPFALLTNETAAVAQPLVIRLAGRSGCREPTGAVVVAQTAAGPQIRLQTAGDGFLVTNEDGLHFAIPREEAAVTVEVRWPGGTRETWPRVPAGREILLIEGRAEALVLHEYPGVASGGSTDNENRH